MRIALVSRELYPYIGGGIAPIVTAAARALAPVAEVTVVTSSDHREQHEQLRRQGDPRLLPENVRIEFVQEPGEDGWGAGLSYMHAYSARAYAKLREIYGDRGPDLIEFADYLGEGFVTVQDRHTAAPWLRDTLVCVRLHTTSEICAILDGRVPDDFHTEALFDAERYALRHADRLLWSGGDVLETYRRFFGADRLAPATKIADAFLREGDVGAGGEGRPALDGERPVRLLYLGRMERRKGVQNLIRAATATYRTDWQLTLLGADTDTGPLGASLRAQLELMVSGDERIEIADPVPRDEVGAFIDRHDVVVIPSLWECWPNVAREAFLHNRPVLATPVGGLTEMVVPGRSGWLAAGNSSRDISDALDEVLDDRDGIERLIASGGPRAQLAALADESRMVDAYRELIAAGRAGDGERPAAGRAGPGERTAAGPTRAAGRPGATKRERVSVVVPYYRLEQHVEETLGSVLAQTHKDVEIIVANDGSLRDEDAIIWELEKRYGARIVTQPNTGLGAARNLGISQATGEFVLPLDADDTIEPHFLERCLEALRARPELAYAGTWVQYVDQDGEPFGDDLGGYLPFGNWSGLVSRNNVAGTCSSLFRRRVFDLGYTYSHDLTSYEDWLLYWELHEAGLHGAVVPERLFNYRVRRESMMREVGAVNVGQLFEELRAHLRERTTTWTAT